MNKTVINYHRSDIKGDANKCIQITGTGETVGGAHDTYRVCYEDAEGRGKDLVTFEFASLQRVGVTNEALLAIVADRLYMFQGGPFACEENGVALSHINTALAALKERTRRVSETTEEVKKMAEDKKDEKPRIRVEAGVAYIGDKSFNLEELKQWKTWSLVEAAAKKLDPPLTSAEMQMIADNAGHLGGGARNGLTEFKSAMAAIVKG